LLSVRLDRAGRETDGHGIPLYLARELVAAVQVRVLR
jgi:hypothetical protein